MSVILLKIENILQYFEFPKAVELSDKAKITWIIRLRWIALCFFSAFILLGLSFGILNREVVPAGMGLLGLLFVFNLLSHVSLSVGAFSPRWILIGMQLGFDSIILTSLVSIFGGIRGPLIPLYYLHSALGALLLPKKRAFPYLLFLQSLLGVLQLYFLIQFPNEADIQFWINTLMSQAYILAFWTVFRLVRSQMENQSLSRIKRVEQASRNQRLRTIGAMAAGFSHEFASPLNAAKLSLERSLRLSQWQEAEQALRSLDQCEQVLVQMNQAQLEPDLSRLKEVKLKDLIVDLIEAWSFEHSHSKVYFECIEEGAVLVPVVNFAQAFINLLDNAEQANQEAKAAPPIITVNFKIEMDPVNGKIAVLSVEDKGFGFADEHLRNAGEPFSTHRQEGVGLGLYICKIFAETLGGEIRIQNLRDLNEPSATKSSPFTLGVQTNSLEKKDGNGAKVSLIWSVGV